MAELPIYVASFITQGGDVHGDQVVVGDSKLLITDTGANGTDYVICDGVTCAQSSAPGGLAQTSIAGKLRVGDLQLASDNLEIYSAGACTLSMDAGALRGQILCEANGDMAIKRNGVEVVHYTSTNNDQSRRKVTNVTELRSHSADSLLLAQGALTSGLSLTSTTSQLRRPLNAGLTVTDTSTTLTCAPFTGTEQVYIQTADGQNFFRCSSTTGILDCNPAGTFKFKHNGNMCAQLNWNQFEFWMNAVPSGNNLYSLGLPAACFTSTYTRRVQSDAELILQPLSGTGANLNFRADGRVNFTGPGSATQYTLEIFPGPAYTAPNFIQLRTSGSGAFPAVRKSQGIAMTQAEIVGAGNTCGMLTSGVAPADITFFFTDMQQNVQTDTNLAKVFRIQQALVTCLDIPLQIDGVANQLVLNGGSARASITLTAPAPAANRVYTIPDAGANSSFVMLDGAQTLNSKTLASPILTGDLLPSAATSSIGSSGTRLQKLWAINIDSTNAVNVSSDARLKRNVVPVEAALETIRRVRSVHYEMIADSTGKFHTGFIAQELEAALDDPRNDAVCVGEDGMYSVRYSEVIALNSAAIQELDETVTDLREQVRSLTELVKLLLTRVPA